MENQFTLVKSLPLFLLLLSMVMVLPGLGPVSGQESTSDQVQLASYTSRGPIFINSEADFSEFPGSGTMTDPYIIENYNISGSAPAISIANTKSYFIIRDSYFKGGGVSGDALVIGEVEHGLIENNTIHGYTGTGISLEGATATTRVTNNTLYSIGAGISTGNNGNTINKNHIFDIQTIGIFGGHEGDHLIEDNVIHDVVEFGITIDRGPDTIVRDNTLSNFGEGGMGIWQSTPSTDEFVANNTRVEHNTITVNGRPAISVTAPNTVFLSNNLTGSNVIDSEGIQVGEGAVGLVMEQNKIRSIHRGIVFWTDQTGSSHHVVRANYFENIGFAAILLEQGSAVLKDIQITANVINGADEGITDFSSGSVTIEGNLVANTRSFAIKFEASTTGIVVTNNDFISTQGSLATSHSADVKFEGNYWSDNQGPRYSIDGTAGLEDAEPAKVPHHMGITLSFDQFENFSFDSDSGISYHLVSDFTDVSLSTALDNSTWELQYDHLRDQPIGLDTLNYTDGDRVYFKLDVNSEFSRSISHYFDFFFFEDAFHYEMTSLSLLEPQETDLSGTVLISWTEVTDSYNLSVTYSVYTLRSGDSNWTTLITHLDQTFFDWETTEVVNGEYLIRIVATSELGPTVEHVSSTIYVVDNPDGVLPNISIVPATPILHILAVLVLLPITRRWYKSYRSRPIKA